MPCEVLDGAARIVEAEVEGEAHAVREVRDGGQIVGVVVLVVLLPEVIIGIDDAVAVLIDVEELKGLALRRLLRRDGDAGSAGCRGAVVRGRGGHGARVGGAGNPAVVALGQHHVITFVIDVGDDLGIVCVEILGLVEVLVRAVLIACLRDGAVAPDVFARIPHAIVVLVMVGDNDACADGAGLRGPGAVKGSVGDTLVELVGVRVAADWQTSRRVGQVACTDARIEDASDRRDRPGGAVGDLIRRADVGVQVVAGVVERDGVGLDAPNADLVQLQVGSGIGRAIGGVFAQLEVGLVALAQLGGLGRALRAGGGGRIKRLVVLELAVDVEVQAAVHRVIDARYEDPVAALALGRKRQAHGHGDLVAADVLLVVVLGLPGDERVDLVRVAGAGLGVNREADGVVVGVGVRHLSIVRVVGCGEGAAHQIDAVAVARVDGQVADAEAGLHSPGGVAEPVVGAFGHGQDLIVLEVGDQVAVVVEALADRGGDGGFGEAVVAFGASRVLLVVVELVVIGVREGGIRPDAAFTLLLVGEAVAVGVLVRSVEDNRVGAVGVLLDVGEAIAIGVAVRAEVTISGERIQAGWRINASGVDVLDFPAVGQTVTVGVGVLRVGAVVLLIDVGKTVLVGVSEGIGTIQRVQVVLVLPAVGHVIAVGVRAHRIHPGVLRVVARVVAQFRIAVVAGEHVLFHVGEAVLVRIGVAVVFEGAQEVELPVIGQTIVVGVVLKVGERPVDDHAAAEGFLGAGLAVLIEDASVLPVGLDEAGAFVLGGHPVLRIHEVFRALAAIVEGELGDHVGVEAVAAHAAQHEVEDGDGLGIAPDVEVIDVHNQASCPAFLLVQAEDEVALLASDGPVLRCEGLGVGLPVRVVQLAVLVKLLLEDEELDGRRGGIHVDDARNQVPDTRLNRVGCDRAATSRRGAGVLRGDREGQLLGGCQSEQVVAVVVELLNRAAQEGGLLVEGIGERVQLEPEGNGQGAARMGGVVLDSHVDGAVHAEHLGDVGIDRRAVEVSIGLAERGDRRADFLTVGDDVAVLIDIAELHAVLEAIVVGVLLVRTCVGPLLVLVHHAVAVQVEFGVSGDAIGLGQCRVGVGEVLVEVDQAVAIRILERVFGVGRVETILDLPPIGHSVAVGVGFDVDDRGILENLEGGVDQNRGVAPRVVPVAEEGRHGILRGLATVIEAVVADQALEDVLIAGFRVFGGNQLALEHLAHPGRDFRLGADVVPEADLVNHAVEAGTSAGDGHARSRDDRRPLAGGADILAVDVEGQLARLAGVGGRDVRPLVQLDGRQAG